MTSLVMALYAEGRSDELFLPNIIQRTAAKILGERSRSVVDVQVPMLVEPTNKGNRQANILSVARQVHGYHLLIVHADADAESDQAARQQRINPGFEQVHQAQQAGDAICGDLVPLIPVQMTEAWLLADPDALRDVIGWNISEALSIPHYGHQIEALADPKLRLSQVLQQASASRSRRRRRLLLRELYEPLGQQISLQRLQTLPSYNRFVEEFTATLLALNFISMNR